VRSFPRNGARWGDVTPALHRAVDQRWAGYADAGRQPAAVAAQPHRGVGPGRIGTRVHDFGSEREAAETLFLALWGTVAITYLAIGIVRVRKQRLLAEDEAALPAPELGRRASFFVTVAASLTGLGAALDVLNASDETQYGPVVTGLGVIVVICAWLLLSFGYARFYSNWTEWRFPQTPQPQRERIGGQRRRSHRI
jgi:hypothetical protein